MEREAPPTARQVYALAAALCEQTGEPFPETRGEASLLIERLRLELGHPEPRLDGRLTSAPGLERNEVLAGGLVTGSGLVVHRVDHQRAAEAASPDEARAVGELWRSLQGVEWVDCEGVVRPLTADDVLIVAPYNNQVGLIRAKLPAARVGTVDKFQGQEAPVVLYSMTSTSAEDAPRGVSFLYDLHRLNVAVSRAKALSVVVASPALLDAEVHDPEQLRQVNALCRFVELAEPRDD
jgi:uncharacterized protein